MSLRGTAYSGDTLVPFFFKPHPAGPAKGSKFVMCTCPHWENCIQQPHSFQDWHMGRLSGGGSKASRSGVRTVRRSVWRRGTAPWGGGAGTSASSAHILSLCAGQREAHSQRLPKYHLCNKAGNVFHLGPRIQLSLQQWVAFKPNI